MSEDVKVTIDLVADFVSRTEVVFEDGQSSNDWLAPYDLRLNVTEPQGPNGYPEVEIVGQRDNVLRFFDEQMPDSDITEDSLESA
ncbi:hypothetical protein pEaSNUABM14_00257 [Erwinia phage pEa_SNUABM_14]|uniref:Uncharacterized protein n=1 Tax=Erwinia phage pEa_SNUABM_7 TaxID=2866695 RepID=A0AAE7WSH6_9CAUD|nr:hypothetical protein MPK74_gp258 [Erwinia phage pEa_SNUABM_7]QYW03216.1 hypothetical protein pEaSNUABM13_00257 [Erwinia phage pEa_SNUABM_13]QYW03558.1 hypothetical protein pEaSNUABM34_00256 [Erwinia phage pEa_SNUABM_34]QYW03899.1 hypothetical protein pEaSNUABM45_00256 [Erwinia phage pEa_SNUABM_45]QYW04240.1 hypothetical protein pEaSNUABM46_00256 [Erwinia phage pEa_SNUABM_46]QYW04582.1 hypothetical protein pEaSNUABM14_00257 [Erwinia phage pEa_SNUABM_14]QYW05269.1 hypothetical protein pEaSNU